MQPNEAKTVTCLVRNSGNIEAALTEPTEKAISARVTVCPRAVRVDKPYKTARIPVRVCNISAKIVTLHAQAEVCILEAIKELNRDPVKEMTNRKLQVEHHQHSIGEKKVDINLDDSVLTSEQKEKVQQFLSGWSQVFLQGPTDLGRTTIVEHEIHLTDKDPFKKPFRKIPSVLIEEVREHLKEMMEIGAIQESTSHFSTNVVIVRKKDGSIRFCIDFRKVNQCTIKDAYPIPQIDDALHSLAGSKYFTTFDLKSGFWQVELRECDKAILHSV